MSDKKRKIGDFITNNSNNELSKIENKYEVSIDPNKNFVYVVILVHGCSMFKNDEPMYLKVPDNVKYINKITYAPLGCVNYVSNDEQIVSNLSNFLKDKNSNSNIPLVENELAENLPDIDNLLNAQIKYIKNTKQLMKIFKLPEAEDRVKDRQILVNADNNNGLYQSFVYSKYFEDNNPNIINKKFEIGSGDKSEMNIYVVFEKMVEIKKGNKRTAENFKKGLSSIETIFRSDGKNIIKSEKYKKFEKDKLSKKNPGNEEPENSIDEHPGIITTEKLLEFLVWCGYEQSVIIDYSCSSCENIDNNSEVNEKKISELEEEAKKNGTIGFRGANTNRFNIEKNDKKIKGPKKGGFQINCPSQRKHLEIRKNKIFYCIYYAVDIL